jgi:hypothetical protein
MVQNLDALRAKLHLGGRPSSHEAPGRDIDESYAALDGAGLKF